MWNCLDGDAKKENFFYWHSLYILLFPFGGVLLLYAGSGGRINKYYEILYSNCFIKGICALWFLPCYVVAEIMLAIIIQYYKGLILIPIFLFLLLYYGMNNSGMFVSTFIRMLLGCFIASFYS
jgi:hypothetical protein